MLATPTPPCRARGPALASAGGSDIFLAKYNASGTHVWSQRFGSTGPDVRIGLAITNTDDVMFAGYFQESVGFGLGNLISAGAHDIVLGKFAK